MRKTLTTFSFAILIAALGCTTNNNPGNGEPTTAPATVPSSTPGASSAATVNPPMASAMTPMTPAERSAASLDAIAVLAADQAYRGRVLGSADPSPSTPAVIAPRVVEPVNPAPLVNPVTTVNSSITSPGTPAITGGDAGGSDAAALFAAPVINGPVATTGVTAGVTAPVTIGSMAVAPTTGVTAGTTVAMTSQTAIPAASATQPLSAVRTQTAIPAATATRPVTAARSTTSSNPVRVVTGTTGAVTVTNVTSPSKNQ